METSIVRSALSSLELELERARTAKNQIEEETTGTYSQSAGAFENAEEALPEILTHLQDMLVIVLEAAGLPDTRNRLIKTWARFKETKELRRTQYFHQHDYLESKPFEYLATLVDGLRISTGEPLNSADAYDLARLEAILWKTPRLLRKRNVVPHSEQEIQNVMHDYLEAFFTEYKHPVTITGITKDYKPDGGVRNLRTAIEFKYANTQSEVSRALGGIFEDSPGYSGSRDWARFYAVIYQTEAFESQDRVNSEMSRGGITWKAMLVTGAGARTRHRRPVNRRRRRP